MHLHECTITQYAELCRTMHTYISLPVFVLVHNHVIMYVHACTHWHAHVKGWYWCTQMWWSGGHVLGIGTIMMHGDHALLRYLMLWCLVIFKDGVSLCVTLHHAEISGKIDEWSLTRVMIALHDCVHECTVMIRFVAKCVLLKMIQQCIRVWYTFLWWGKKDNNTDDVYECSHSRNWGLGCQRELCIKEKEREDAHHTLMLVEVGDLVGQAILERVFRQYTWYF